MIGISVRGTAAHACAALWLLGAVPVLAAQEAGEGDSPPVALPAAATPIVIADNAHSREAPVATAVRIDVPISIDGQLDEGIWMTAPAISDFRQTVPDEGAPVTERTEIRFLYDEENIYVGAWLWDRGQVLSRLARRDAGVPDADFFVVIFDSYHDHSTGYRFATSPAAMKREEIMTDRGGGGGGPGGGGGFGDTSWDPIWDVESSITADGWFVEMRIPFSQLRYSDEHEQVWGLQVERKIRRHGEDTVWAFTPRTERGGMPRFGHLVGIEGIVQGKRLEVLPYVGGRAEYTEIARSASAGFENPFRSGSDYFSNAGVDLKYRITPNMTLDATVNPDFGQVELDPAVINLSAFETRFDEKRPFFIEGAEIFQFGGGGGSQLLYSRRIGRAPQGSVPSSAAYSDVPGASTILGATKLTGKTVGGWSVALLDAVTNETSATFVEADGLRGTAIVEPFTNYFAGRVRKDSNSTGSSFGIIATAVNRNLSDETLRGRLRSAAYAVGIDGRRDFANRTWTISGSFAPSYIMGEASAINLAQRSSARYLHRPDADHLKYDPDATSLAGMFGRVAIQKGAGDWRGNASLTATSPGFEVNDIGFQSNADRIGFNTNLNYDQTRPGRYFRRWGIGFTPSANWNFAGEPQQLQVSADFDAQLLSFHGFNVRASRQFASWDDRFTRGGPNVRTPAGYSGGVNLNSDGRRTLQLRTGANFGADDGGGWNRSINASISARFRGIYEFSMGPQFRRSRTAAQYVTAVSDDFATDTYNRRFIFAALDQTTVSLGTRFNATFSPNLSLEIYAEPLLSSGDYGTLMEFAAPGTFDFNRYGVDTGTMEMLSDGRFRIDPDGAGPAAEFHVRDADFNVRSLLGNAVLRWEWRPGSTIFLVWQQSRSDRLTGNFGDIGANPVGSFDLRNDARALFDLKPDNIFLIKVNFWLNP